jgi:hypothetical protein
MIEFSVDTAGLLRMEKALLALSEKALPTAMAKTLTRLAVGARSAVMEKLPTVFHRPTPFTQNSIRYQVATRETLQAMVYISDDAAKGISPRKYLFPEIEGGGRNYKRSEKALIAKGMMRPDQHIVPARGIDLDAFGNVSGPLMTRILSRLSAFGEMGYAANASDRTKRKLKRQGLASHRVADVDGRRQADGTNYFIARSKGDREPLGVYQLIAKGKVVPVLYFVNRDPRYQVRFPFIEMVNAYCHANFEREMIRAVGEEIARIR